MHIKSPNGRRFGSTGVLWIGLVLGVIGCQGSDSPPISTVSGTVTFDGEPVSEGTVNFYNPDKGFGASAPLESDGTFSLQSQYGKGIPLGSYQVSISPPSPEGDEEMGMDPAAQPEPKEYPNIPEKYRDASSSGFTAEVTEGSNTFEFAMKPQ